MTVETSAAPKTKPRWQPVPASKCVGCSKAVYENEKLVADERVFHKTCFKSKQNVGFDRLADNHIGHSEHGAKLDQFINAQKSSGLPYRIYNPPGKGAPPYFFYGYTPNGWGYQLTGTCSDASLCPKAPFYDMCTQGVLPDCTSA